LLWTLFLGDFLSNEVFRRETLRILNHGESIHTLQRVIHFGSIAAARGRRQEELVAISGSLTLLASVAMTRMTQRIQHVLDTWHGAGIRRVEPEILRHVAPVHFQDVNFRGVMRFPAGALPESPDSCDVIEGLARDKRGYCTIIAESR
jgi:hypothetical protein